MPTPTDSDHRPVVVDLFAGAGGLSLGFEMGGFDVVAAVEYDPVHAATHAYNFPNAPVLCRDVRQVGSADLLAAARVGWNRLHSTEEWDGVVDVIVGGPSCQGFSTMGKQDSKDDRNELVGEFVRLVEGVAPRAFVMENVPGILSPKFAGLLGDAVRRLREAGYSLRDYSEPLDASDYGVPQRRRRVFIVGVAEGVELQPIRKSDLGAVSVSDAFAGLPSLVGRQKGDGELLELNDTEAVAYAQGLRNPYLARLHATMPREASGPGGVLSGYLVTEHTKASVERFTAVPQGGTDSISRLWKLHEAQPSRTLRAGTGSERGAFSAARPLHPIEPRVITVREAARLHSFPDWFRFHATNWHGHRQIGNSVPPLLAQAVADSVFQALRRSPISAVHPPDSSSPSVRLLSMTASEAREYFDADKREIPAKRRRTARGATGASTAGADQERREAMSDKLPSGSAL